MAQGVIYQEANGDVILVNPAAQRISGIVQDQIKNPDIIDANLKFIHEDGSEFPAKDHPSMQALKTGRLSAMNSWECTCRLKIHIDGSW